MWDRQNNIIVRTAFNTQAPDGTQPAGATIAQGIIPSSRVAFSVNPTANDTLGIGAATIKYVAALGAQTAQTQVKILGTAALTLAATIDAINGTTDANVVQGSTPVTATVLADSVTTQLRLRNATVRGGVAKAGVSPSVALTASITGGASAWLTDNLNLSGKSPGDVNEAIGIVTLSAAQITGMGTGINFELAFTPTIVQWQFADNTGKLLATTTDVVTISGNSIVLTTAGAQHLVAGNIFSFYAAA